MSSKNDVAFLGEMRLGGGFLITSHWRAMLAYRAIAISGVASGPGSDQAGVQQLDRHRSDQRRRLDHHPRRASRHRVQLLKLSMLAERITSASGKIAGRFFCAHDRSDENRAGWGESHETHQLTSLHPFDAHARELQKLRVMPQRLEVRLVEHHVAEVGVHLQRVRQVPQC